MSGLRESAIAAAREVDRLKQQEKEEQECRERQAFTDSQDALLAEAWGLAYELFGVEEGTQVWAWSSHTDESRRGRATHAFTQGQWCLMLEPGLWVKYYPETSGHMSRPKMPQRFQVVDFCPVCNTPIDRTLQVTSLALLGTAIAAKRGNLEYHLKGHHPDYTPETA